MSKEKECPKCKTILIRLKGSWDYKCPSCDKWFRTINNYRIGNGSTVKRLIKRLTKQMEEQFKLKITKMDLYPALGAYRHPRMDVQPWTGAFYVDGSDNPMPLASWSTMTACLKYGFDCEYYDGEFRVDHKENL